MSSASKLPTPSLTGDGESPQTHRRPPYFPGWTMVGVAAAAQFMSAPGQSYSVAAFKQPMETALSLSETSYSLAYAFATVVSGALLPFVGRMIDRYGARLMLPTISLLLGFACIGMSYVSGLPSLYLGFSCVRSLGQGALTLVAAWLVGEWFARRRGFATAMSGLGGSFSVMLVPLLNVFVISNFGWRTGWLVLAGAVWCCLLLPSLFLVRNRPEDLGLLPDGDSSEPLSDPQPSDPAAQQKPTRKIQTVLLDPTFWKLLSVPASSGMVGTGLIFHAVSLLGSRGVPAGWAVALISVQATVGTCVALLAGWLTDRYPARYLLVTAMLLLTSASTTILMLPTPWVALLYAVMLGLHGSILRSTGMVVWMDYYGRQNQGTIRGIAMAVMIFAAAAGPLPLALSNDMFQTYNLGLYLFITVPLLAAALVWTVGPPKMQPGKMQPG